MKYPLRIEIQFDEDNNGYIKALRCFKNTVQFLEEMKFSKGTIIISKSEKNTSIDIINLGSSETWMIENQ